MSTARIHNRAEPAFGVWVLYALIRLSRPQEKSSSRAPHGFASTDVDVPAASLANCMMCGFSRASSPCAARKVSRDALSSR